MPTMLRWSCRVGTLAVAAFCAASAAAQAQDFPQRPITFVVGLGAGMAGAMMANYIGFIAPKTFNMVKSTELTITVIFGGLGSISGSVLGTIILTSLPEIFRAFSDWRLVFYGLAVVVHPANPVSQLTLDQLSDIFSGTITNWKEGSGRRRLKNCRAFA